MSLDIWLAFFAACWVISLSPGAGAIASMTSGLKFGFWQGYWNVIGMQLAILLHFVMVATGIGAIIASSALLFNLIKWFGVLYLVYLGYRQWSQSSKLTAHTEDYKLSAKQLIARVFLVNITNPKAIIFMLAIIPQFLNPEKPLAQQYGVLSITMVSVDLLVMGCYTGFAARAMKFLISEKQLHTVNRIFATLFIVAAILLAYF
ncbi:LysE family transporter [Catenovulum sediminis]|uniref:LysE family transporter n=1 Tax=Catenovulum sediminis TaxID=1740262 RepID=A0ABV1RLK0_9ALTE